jgi:hypothetical protein
VPAILAAVEEVVGVVDVRPLKDENKVCGSGFAWIRINWSCWIQVLEGKKDPQIYRVRTIN